MSTTTEQTGRSWLMRLLRMAPGPLFLVCVVGGALMAIGAGLQDHQAGNDSFAILSSEAGERKQLLWDVGTTMLALGGVLFIALLWGGVYLQVVEASRGMPGLRPVEEPTMAPEPAAKLAAMKRSLSNLGFRHDGWFSLDDFDETHVSAWTHGVRPAVAFVLYYPVSGGFRLRIVRRFDDGPVLVSSTRLNDLAYPPPPGVYLQVRYKATAEELWAWHLEGEKIFPPADGTRPEPKDLYVEVSGRWGRHWRSDPTWLLAVEPVEECWRMYHLNGMPVREQVEQGWAPKMIA